MIGADDAHGLSGDRGASWRLAIPNWLTALRVVMALVFFIVLTLWRFEGSAAAAERIDWLIISSAVLFIVASLTDILDGYLARRWKAETTFGRIMDPFADKVLVLGALVFLAGPDFWHPEPWTIGARGSIRRLAGEGVQLSGVYPWMAVTIIARELLVTSIRGVLESQGVRFPADWSGKVKMFVQSAAVPVILITIGVTRVTPWLPAEGEAGLPWGRWVIDAAVWTALSVTVLSGIPYVVRAVSLATRRRGKEAT